MEAIVDAEDYDVEGVDVAWCPGCGNFMILRLIKQALSELDIEPQNLAFVSGIGQAAKLPQYLNCNYFNGLHGRSLPAATAIKISNPELTVIADSGDGCMYGEGGNHFIHTIRRNTDITHLVHNNMVYGLTKGQASPTSQAGFTTPVQTDGVVLEPFNPLVIALALNASFVARAYCKHQDQSKDIIRRAIEHKGYALVDIFQVCVSFNRVNTYDWFEDHTYYLEDDYETCDRQAAVVRASESEKLPLGVFYERKIEESFEDKMRLGGGKEPLYQQDVSTERFKALLETFRN
jgi:2-oxoglutarate ferredoxin oxidoreductase subunit beta